MEGKHIPHNERDLLSSSNIWLFLAKIVLANGYRARQNNSECGKDDEQRRSQAIASENK